MSELRRKLTVKQRKFCHYYIKLGNATEAAIKAGYSKKTAKVVGHQNLTKLNVKKYIDSQLKRINSRSIADEKEIFQFYTNVLRAKITEDSVGSTMDGEFKIKKRPDIKDRISAANELMKRYDPLVRAKIKKIIQSTDKLKAETKIKALLAKQNDTKNNQTITKVDELLDQIFDDKK